MNSKGFTLVEIVITITLLAIIMLPTSLILASYSRSVSYSDNMLLGAHLANREWSVENRVTYSSNQLTNYMSYGYILNIVYTLFYGTDGKINQGWCRSQIDSYRKYPVDLSFRGFFLVCKGAVYGVGVSNRGNSEPQASKLTLSSLTKRRLHLQVTGGRNLTITGVNIKTISSPHTLTSIKFSYYQAPTLPWFEHMDTRSPVIVTDQPQYLPFISNFYLKMAPADSQYFFTDTYDGDILIQYVLVDGTTSPWIALNA